VPVRAGVELAPRGDNGQGDAVIVFGGGVDDFCVLGCNCGGGVNGVKSYLRVAAVGVGRCVGQIGEGHFGPRIGASGRRCWDWRAVKV
jgi:hypothetical protein